MQEVKTELLSEINQWSVCDVGGLRQIGLLGYIAFKMLRGWSHKETSKIPFQWAVAFCFSIDKLQNHINSRVMLSHTWADSACPQKCPGKWRHSRLTQSLIWKPSGFAPESRTIICANCQLDDSSKYTGSQVDNEYIWAKKWCIYGDILIWMVASDTQDASDIEVLITFISHYQQRHAIQCCVPWQRRGAPVRRSGTQHCCFSLESLERLVCPSGHGYPVKKLRWKR